MKRHMPSVLAAGQGKPKPAFETGWIPGMLVFHQFQHQSLAIPHDAGGESELTHLMRFILDLGLVPEEGIEPPTKGL